ncbi:MAG TPA: hypothetical protein VII55_00195 [Candidatus Saccharimonadales bacterium]
MAEQIPGQVPQPSDQDPQQQLRAALSERVREQLSWLNAAAEVVGGQGALVVDVFDVPPPVRDDAPMPDWTHEQTEEERTIGRRFGYGAVETVQSGLQGGVRKKEGGKVWKLLAEDVAVEAEAADTLVYSGSPDRSLGEDEHEYLREHEEELGASFGDETTEYDFQAFLARRRADGKLLDEPLVLPFGYAVSDGNPTVFEPTGQLLQMGETSKGQSVQLLRVDREDYKDEGGKPKFRHRPDSSKLMGFLADVLEAQGKPDDPVAVVTSGTYASRQVDAMIAGLSHNRQFGVVMYGRSVLAALGAPVPAELPLNQLPGELRLRHDKLLQLQTELEIVPAEGA